MSNRLIENHRAPWDAPAGAFSDADRDFMNRARDLARRGAGRTWPNPAVGAVVVREGREVGAGYHHRDGEAHAEAVALDQAGEAARGATLYVTLEPCAHHGRTPPCVERILQSGISRVVFPAIDPDPRVRGRGMAALRAAGVRVDTGCLEHAGVLDSLGYYHDRLGLSPTVTLKIALSRDGMVARARGQRDDVTGMEARADVHALRALHDAVVVGVETLLIDRPRLDCRLLEGGVDRMPLPVVLDTDARTPIENEWARTGREHVVVCAPDADRARVEALRQAGAHVLHARRAVRGLDIADALRALEGAGRPRILVEGGPGVFWSFADSGLWDAAWLYRSRRSFGPGGVRLFRSQDERLPGRLVDERPMGEDRRLGFVNESSWTKVTAALAEALS